MCSGQVERWHDGEWSCGWVNAKKYPRKGRKELVGSEHGQSLQACAAQHTPSE